MPFVCEGTRPLAPATTFPLQTAQYLYMYGRGTHTPCLRSARRALAQTRRAHTHTPQAPDLLSLSVDELAQVLLGRLGRHKLRLQCRHLPP